MNPAALTCQALLNCLIREVSIPEQQAWEDHGHLVIRLARSGPVLRAGLRRPPRVSGPGWPARSRSGVTCAGSRSAGRTWPG